MSEVEKLIKILTQDNCGLEIRFISGLVICKTLYFPFIRICATEMITALTQLSRLLLINCDCPLNIKAALGKINLT